MKWQKQKSAAQVSRGNNAKLDGKFNRSDNSARVLGGDGAGGDVSKRLIKSFLYYSNL